MLLLKQLTIGPPVGGQRATHERGAGVHLRIRRDSISRKINYPEVHPLTGGRCSPISPNQPAAKAKNKEKQTQSKVKKKSRKSKEKAKKSI